jgi:hypothetical protein
MRTARDGTVSRERGRAASPRGRTLEPKKDQGNLHKISPLGKIGDMLKLDGDDKEAGDGWKEFKKGLFVIAPLIISRTDPLSNAQVYTHTQYLL